MVYHLCLETPESNISRVMRHIDGVPIFNLKSEKKASWARSVIQTQMSEEKIRKIKRKIEQQITN